MPYQNFHPALHHLFPVASRKKHKGKKKPSLLKVFHKG